MLYLFVLFILISLIGVSFKNIKEIDNGALTKERTTMVNGMFVGIVLFSHFNSYAIYDCVGIDYNIYVYFIISVVTTFILTSLFDKVLKRTYKLLIN